MAKASIASIASTTAQLAWRAVGVEAAEVGEVAAWKVSPAPTVSRSARAVSAGRLQLPWARCTLAPAPPWVTKTSRQHGFSQPRATSPGAAGVEQGQVFLAGFDQVRMTGEGLDPAPPEVDVRLRVEAHVGIRLTRRRPLSRRTSASRVSATGVTTRV